MSGRSIFLCFLFGWFQFGVCFVLFSFFVDFLYIKELELTEEEEAIKANLVDNQELPPEVLDNIVPDWWRKEPFR